MTYVPLSPTQAAGVQAAIGFVGSQSLEYVLGYLETLGLELPGIGTAAALLAWLTFEIAAYNELKKERDMPCVNTHSTKTQGAGLCCAQVASGALSPTIGSSVMVTTAPSTANPQGRCGTCRVVASTSKKPSQAGKPRLRFSFGGPGCPTAAHGCCALSTALIA